MKPEDLEALAARALGAYRDISVSDERIAALGTQILSAPRPWRRRWLRVLAPLGLLALGAGAIGVPAAMHASMETATPTVIARTAGSSARVFDPPAPQGLVPSSVANVHDEPESTRPPDEDEPVVEPVVESVVEPVVERATERRPRRRARPVPENAPSPVTTSPTPARTDADTSTLEDELKWIRAARRQLDHDAQSALIPLGEHERRFGLSGVLSPERLVLTAAAHCRSGNHERGRAAIAALEHAFAGHASLHRARRECDLSK